MAIISTRQPTATQVQLDILEDVDAEIFDILKEYTSNAINQTASSPVQPDAPIEDKIEAVRVILEIQQAIAIDAVNEATTFAAIAAGQEAKIYALEDKLESMRIVPYDEALDHATMDLMDAMASTGQCEINHNGELEFNGRVTFGKGDLKPLLREAIYRWSGLKI